jgi:hypothetical protein
MDDGDKADGINTLPKLGADGKQVIDVVNK